MKGTKKDSRGSTWFGVIWFFFEPYKYRVVGLFFLFLMSGVLEAATIAAVYPILDAAFAPGTETGNILLSIFQIFAEWIPISDLFISYCIVFIIFAIATFIVKYFAISYRVRFIAHLVSITQQKIYRKIISADYQYFVGHKQGELLYNIESAPQRLATLIMSVTEFMSQGLLSISVLILLFSLSWTGALGVLGMGGFYIFLSRYLGNRISYRASQNEVQASRESNVVINESISGIKQIKVFSVGQKWISRFAKVANTRWQNYRTRVIWQQLLPVVLILAVYLAVALVVLLIKVINPAGYLELIPVFGAFAFAIFRLIPFVSSIGSTMMSLQASLPDCEIVHGSLTQEIRHLNDGKQHLDSFSRAISFSDVSFAYEGRSRILNGFSVVFEKGKTVAIVGRSGSGKTTVISLMLRLFDLDEGEITVDGVNIKDVVLESWLNNIGYVSQDIFILNDTIERNITFGVEGYSREDVVRAAEYADAHGFITDLPEGYNTLVGDKGMRLSGGQAQRLAVARAMLRDPEILIFDEATNNLDTISEIAVQRAIEKISKDHTVILVAHRLSTIENADTILVIDEGKLVEQGTHKELLELHGVYWQLNARQAD